MIRLALALALLADPAAAFEVAALAASIAAAAASAAVPASGIVVAGFVIGQTAAIAAISIASSLVGAGLNFLSARANAPKPPAIRRELGAESSIQPYRFCYGRVRAPGSPMAREIVGDVQYLCHLINSRPSDALEGITINGQGVTWTGDPTDLDGPGASLTTGLFGGGVARFWFLDGTHDRMPAELVAEQPSIFRGTDAWRGRTVVWWRLIAGSQKAFLERWRSPKPDIQYLGRWTKVWDMRDRSQNPDDPATWRWSENRTLCMIDALRHAPRRAYPRELLHIEHLAEVADTDDEIIGGAPRYRVGAVVVWNERELEDQLAPFAAAGAGEFVRVDGRLTISPGVWEEPIATLTNLLAPQIAYDQLLPGREIASSVTATYLAPERDWQTATAVYEVPGAVASDGEPTADAIDLSFVPYAAQVQRVLKIEALRRRAQRRLSSTFAPDEAFVAVPGSVVKVAIPGRFARLNGLYVCDQSDPQGLPATGGRVAVSVPMTLRETGPDIYAWDHEVEFVPPEAMGTIDAALRVLAVPTGIVITTGAAAALDTGETVLPGFRVAVDPEPTGRADVLEVRLRIGTAPWETVGRFDAEARDGLGKAFGVIRGLTVGETYEVGLRWREGVRGSDWSATQTIGILAPDAVIPVPLAGSAVTGTPPDIVVGYTTPNADTVRGLRFFRATTNDSGAATAIGADVAAVPNARYEIADSSTAPSTTYWYWARTVGPFGQLSDFSDAVSATTGS